jgi:DNA-binding response OmpR family regulator
MPASVLIVDHDRHISALVAELLREAGFAVAELTDTTAEAIQAQVHCLEPDVVLLDGSDKLGYGESWAKAAWLHERERPIKVIMFTCHAKDLAEGRLGMTERSQRAAFVGFLSKPFDIDVLPAAVRCAYRK